MTGNKKKVFSLSAGPFRGWIFSLPGAIVGKPMRKTLCILTCAFAFISARLPAAENPPSPLIREFSVHGLDRTKPSVIEPYYLPYRGKPLSEFSRDGLIQKLRSLGIFHTVDVVPGPARNDEVVVVILVEEKWTLVPIPIGGATGGGRVYGGFMFLESNLFGYNKKMYGGGFLSTNGWKGIFGYIDPRLAGSDNMLFLGFSGGVDDMENEDPDGTVYQRYRTVGLSLRGEVFRPLGRGFSLGAGFEFQEQSLDEDYPDGLDPPRPARAAGPVLSLRYQNFFYDRILVYGLFAQARYEYKFSFDEYSLSAQYYATAFGKHRLVFRGTGIYAPDTPRILETRIAERALKTLPDDSVADSVLGGNAGLEFMASDFGWGALTFLLSYEGGLYVREKSAAEYTHGPLAGIRIYMSKLAVPAFGFDLSYSVPEGRTYLTVNVGIQM